MARQFTKAEANAECSRLQHENHVMSIAVNYMATVEPDASEIAHASGARYVFKLYGGTAAHGGIVTTTFHCPGQKPSATAHYLEDLAQSSRRAVTEESAAIRDAILRLYAKRNRLVDAVA